MFEHFIISRIQRILVATLKKTILYGDQSRLFVVWQRPPSPHAAAGNNNNNINNNAEENTKQNNTRAQEEYK